MAFLPKEGPAGRSSVTSDECELVAIVVGRKAVRTVGLELVYDVPT